MKPASSFFWFVAVASSFVAGDDFCGGEAARDLCREFSNRTCAECIAANRCCVWIYEKDIDVDRCNVAKNIPTNVKKVIMGGSSNFTVLNNKPFSESAPTVDEPATQIRPQKIRVQLRKGEPVNLTLSYRAAPNYALDIYYLMDLTFSMVPHREQLSRLGHQLAENLAKMTSNYKIAFGYYSDKVRLPYYATTDRFKANPCFTHETSCEPGYNFRHAFNFSRDLDKFVKRVNASKHTANLDDLEGGLDALMQIMVCQKELQWRKHSRKFVILATDGLLHAAGDGILGGITRRNNNTCRLVAEGDYLVYDGLDFDYPSVEEIYRRLSRNKMSVLFAVDKKVKDYYHELQRLLSDVSDLELLTDDPDNILNLVRNGYTRLVRQVHFAASNPNDDLKISLASNCLSTSAPQFRRTTWNSTSSCDNVKIGTEYVFDVNLELLELPKDGRKMDRIVIEEMNIEESLEIEVEYLGSTCDCSDEAVLEPLKHGEFVCGKYNCHSGWIGRTCSERCDPHSGRFENETYTSTTCLNRGEFDDFECKCICDSQYMGKYCEYDQCKRNRRGEICSNHGECLKGECLCHAGYTGDMCDCVTSTAGCYAPNATAPCMNHGRCVCGRCVCDTSGDVKYKGQFCEHCKGCNNLCEHYDADVVALTDGRPLDERLAQRYVTNEVKTFKDIDDTTKCRHSYIRDDFSCFVTYTYVILGTGKVKIDHRTECTEIINFKAAGGIAFAGIVCAAIVGLLTWRAYASYKDRRDYAKYLEDKQYEQFRDLNPLYKSPHTTFINPTHRSSQEQQSF